MSFFVGNAMDFGGQSCHPSVFDICLISRQRPNEVTHVLLNAQSLMCASKVNIVKVAERTPDLSTLVAALTAGQHSVQWWREWVLTESVWEKFARTWSD